MRIFSSQRGADIDPGQEICGWKAYDYHPHERGWLWYVCFCSVFFGGAAWALFGSVEPDWLMALTFFVVMAIYFWVHQQGHETHEVRIHEHAIVIDEKIFPRKKFTGYWFVYGNAVSVLNLELNKKNEQKISLQMGDLDPDWFRFQFEKIELPELEDKEESLIDLWIRALKL